MAVEPKEREVPRRQKEEEEGLRERRGQRIRDLKSFNQVTGGPREVAGLYFYYVLDPLVELALDIARDFFKRPQMFVEVGDPPIAPLLARLHARIGATEKIPAREQRTAIFAPLFGEFGLNGSAGDFPRLRDELVQASAAFAERSFDSGVGMLRERVRETNRPFQEYLTGLQGASISWSREEALPTLTEGITYSIMRSKAVSAVYGIPAAARKAWPYAEDSNGDKLVEEVSRHGMWTNGSTNGSTPALTRESFTNLQRIAIRGAEALATIIDFDEGADDADVDLLITKVYSWGSALRQTEFPFVTPSSQPSLTAPVVAS